MQTSLTRRLLLAAATVAVVASFDVGGALAQEAPAAAAAIAEASASSKYVFNTLLFLVAGFLVMFMAAGFAMLEAGLVRTKNVSMQCTKNIVLYAIGGIMFWLVGYNLMYDGVAGGYFGSFLPKVIPPTDNDPGNYAAASDWFFQMVFCATTASIVSGTLAERIKLWPFLLFIVVLTGAWYLGASDRTLGISMAWGVFLSGLLQVSMLVYGILKEGFPLSLRRPSISRPVRRLVTLAIPTAIAAGITQVNLLVGQIIASGQDGAIAIMNYADRLMQLPLGVIAISIGVVLLPELTRALAAGDTGEATKLQNRSIEFGLGLTLPAAVGLFTIPVPLIALLYERGAFTRDLTEITASVLAWFAVGLPAFVLIKIFQPAYYAREDMKTPMWFSGANAIVNVTLALLLFPVYGVAGLAIATSAAGWLNVVLLGGALWRQGLLQLDAATIRNSGIIVATSLLVGLVLWAGQGIFSEMLLHDALGIRIFSVLALILVAMLVYFAITIGTGAIPGQQLLRLLRRPRKNSAT